jgi:hypothetical protein
MEPPGRSEEISPQFREKIELMETKLSELDPILIKFCSEHGYHLRSLIGVWPRRAVWTRNEIDRTLDLTMDLSVQSFLDRGFYPEMPWSLFATGSVRALPAHFLSTDIFRALPFSSLSALLAKQLSNGLTILRHLTSEEIMAKGEVHGQPDRLR